MASEREPTLVDGRLVELDLEKIHSMSISFLRISVHTSSFMKMDFIIYEMKQLYLPSNPGQQFVW